MFVDLDVHRKVCYGTVLDDRGRVVKQGRFSNDPDSLDGFLEGLGESQAEHHSAAWTADRSMPARRHPTDLREETR